MKSQYNYPDPGDAITFKVIDTYQHISDYWSNSEKWILNNIHKIIADKGFSNYKLLDAGCGEGRLFGEFIENAAKIVGIEPDAQRFGNAQICIKENNFQDKVSIYNSLLEEAKFQETFDIVLSSHIIQHIPSHSVYAHLEKLASLTTEGGLLIINTNTAHHLEERFIKGFVKDGVVTEEDISREEFDKLTAQTGQLPVHMFNRDKVCKYMQSIGFDVVDMKVFHVETEAQKAFPIDTDATINADPNLARKYGRDICFVFQKRKQLHTIEEGALAEFCAFNIKLYGIDKDSLVNHLNDFQESNKKIFSTAPFCTNGSTKTLALNTRGSDKEIKTHECFCRQEADKFCSTGQKINNSYRYLVGTTYFNFKGKTLPLKVSVTLFPYRNIGILCMNVIIKDLTVEETIALKQFFGNTGNNFRRKDWRTHYYFNKTIKTADKKEQVIECQSDMTRYFSNTDNNPEVLEQVDGAMFWFMCNNLIKDMTLALNSRHCKKFSWKEECNYMSEENDDLEVIIDDFKRVYVCESKFIHPTLEIKKTNFNIDNDDAVAWAAHNCLPLYGLLVGDEGYKYIPKELAIKRITEHHWGTRKFVNIFAYSFNVVMLNFKSSADIGEIYQDYQRNWSDQYYDKKRNAYFMMSPCIAGVDHGLFRIIERNIVVYFENYYISKVDQSSAININKKRNKILLFIYKTTTSLDEINDMFHVISNASGTSDVIESIKQRLALRSEEKNLVNQKQNNYIILALTIISAILGLFAISSDTNAFRYISNTGFFKNPIIEYRLWAYLTGLTILGISIMCIIIYTNWHSLVAFFKHKYYKISKASRKHK